MNHSGMSAETGYQIRFRSLLQEGRALSFPCDSHGEVDLNALTQHALDDYLFARAMIGREFATPALLERTSELLS
ncbi:MAG TPA: hypothetical protein VKI18_11610 [Albitalea sp.]|nr:hypothetical protein [Albitalea sp.]